MNIKKAAGIFLMFLFTSGIAWSQKTELEQHIDKGVELHDNGDYKGAIKEYEKALKIDNKSPLANYEMGHTYFTMKEYSKAIKHADAVIDAKSDFLDMAYILKGNSLDQLGKTKDAIKSYKIGIKDNPNNHLLHYNLALTYYKAGEKKDAEEYCIKAIEVNRSHPSSHLLLSVINSEKGERVKALLSVYHFLMLEPASKRTETAIKLLDQELNKGVSKTGENAITITLNSDASSEFSAAELTLSMLQASKDLEENKGKTEQQLFVENTTSFFTVLGELKDKNKGFWWDYYVTFFYSMVKNEHVETFCYYINVSRNNDDITKWLEENETKIEAFGKWYSEFGE